MQRACDGMAADADRSDDVTAPDGGTWSEVRRKRLIGGHELVPVLDGQHRSIDDHSTEGDDAVRGSADLGAEVRTEIDAAMPRTVLMGGSAIRLDHLVRRLDRPLPPRVLAAIVWCRSVADGSTGVEQQEERHDEQNGECESVSHLDSLRGVAPVV